MSRFTMTIITIALVLSGAAYYAGDWAKRKAEQDLSASAYVLPKGVEVPPQPPPGAKLERVDRLDDNPFIGPDSNGVLIPKDPDRRAKLEAAPLYREASNTAYFLAKAIPIIAIILLVVARKRTEKE